MKFLQQLKVLKESEPDIAKTVKTLKKYGLISFGLGIWNCGFTLLIPFDMSRVNFPATYPYAALITMSIIGSLCFVSARGIQKKEKYGITSGRAALGLFILAITAFSVMIYTVFGKNQPFVPIGLFYVIGMTFTFGPLAILSYFGIKYLGYFSFSSIGPKDMRRADLNNS